MSESRTSESQQHSRRVLADPADAATNRVASDAVASDMTDLAADGMPSDIDAHGVGVPDFGAAGVGAADFGAAGVGAAGAGDRTGCPWHDVQALLRQVKLRPTRQRMALGWLLFAKGGRHLTAEMLYEEASRAKIAVSLATIYNTLHQFTNAGLLREVTVNGSKTYFDTNVTDHHHFFVENDHNLIDIPAADDIIGQLPQIPEGYELSRVDVVVRLRRKRR